MKKEPGQLAFISTDCREGGGATGKHGIYEGDQPLSIILFKPGGEIEGEYRYSLDRVEGLDEVGIPDRASFFKQAAAESGYTFPMTDENSTVGEQMTALGEVSSRARELEKDSEKGFYQIHKNPRIRLEDGSVIWGCECFWRPVEGKIPEAQIEGCLAVDQASIEEFKSMFADVIKNKAIAEDPKIEERESDVYRRVDKDC